MAGHRKVTHASLILLLALASLSFKCGGPGGQQPDPLRNAARAADAIAKSLSEAVVVKRELARQGKITPAEELKLTQQLLKVNTADQALVRRLKSLNGVPDAAGRQQLLDIFSELNTVLNDFGSNGIPTLQQPEARNRLNSIFVAIKASAQIIAALNDCHEVPPDCYQCAGGPLNCPGKPM